MRRELPKSGEPGHLITNPTRRDRIIERGLMIFAVIVFLTYAYLNLNWMIGLFR